MPAVNLSNKLNPNNMHFDKRLAEQYKYMSKTEKEMLWQQDRTEQLQALQVGLEPLAAVPLSCCAAKHISEEGLKSQTPLVYPMQEASELMQSSRRSFRRSYELPDGAIR